ncbi:zinc finger protein 26-like [Uranotaenia lowii]|uniref:zinc finger protein 26-like n=1 Tax=Uranotaenia lowii TaxID=190385 RepID=UPI002479CF2B|nr:zinc finger protein 26-like [Uranotaenia lowii]XP_055597433.1 zinc finger protein 26-like [Uranotaenia lowii]XP_055597434.1 zinc finger protein 26-like [Uranotaenia lowii]
MASCRICSENCTENTRLMKRDFREKAQDIFGLMIQHSYPKETAVCDCCEKRINKFYAFKHVSRHQINTLKTPDKTPVSAGFAIKENVIVVESSEKPEDDDGIEPLEMPKVKKRYGPPPKRTLVRFTKEQLATKTKKELYIERHRRFCELCGKTVNHNQFESHMNGHRGVKPYACPEPNCGAAFKCQRAQNAHFRRNHSNEQYPCFKCGKVLTSTMSLKSHMASHMERTIECEVCGLKVLRKSVLDVHMRMHTQKRDYQCPYCPKAFYVKTVLTLHLRSHTGEKPYACHICKFASAHRILYVKHMQKFHPAAPIYTLQEMQKLAIAEPKGGEDIVDN